MQNPGKLVKAVAQMQSRMTAIQKELAATEYPGSSGGGLVKLTVRGDGELTALDISADAMAEGAEVVAELVRAAHSAAVKAKEAHSKEKLKSVSAGLLPAGFSVPGLG